MEEHPNATLVRTLADARLRRDADALRRLLAEDVVWHVRDPTTDVIRSRDALIDYWTAVAEEGAGVSFAIHDIVANDMHAVALVETTYRRLERAPLTMRHMWIFHCSGGKVDQGWFWYEDPAAHDAYWS